MQANSLGGGEGFWKLLTLGVALIIVGVFVVMAAVLLQALRGGKGEVGGVIIIGPFPIVIGSSAEAAKTVILMALVLMIMVAIVMYVLPAIISRSLVKG